MRFEAGENEAGRRLDRILKKVLKGASLSFIYKSIRKDVKVNGKRAKPETLLAAGDAVEIFLPDELVAELRQGRAPYGARPGKREFEVVFEDENVLAIAKPFGLLTHGDVAEKKNTLAAQVAAYMAERGVYEPGGLKTFTPAPASRLDRNTTGLVLFGKNYPAARDLALMLKGDEGAAEGACVEKVYLTVVKGLLPSCIILKGRMLRETDRNVTRVLPEEAGEGRVMVTEVRPLAVGKGYTLVEARLLTGRTHQIRAQLAAAGYPIIGDRKYGDKEANRIASQKYGLTAQLLHAGRLTVKRGTGSLEYLTGETFRARAPGGFREIAEDLGCTTSETE